MQYVAYLLVGVAVAAVILVVSIFGVYRASYREGEVASVKAWVKYQEQMFPPQSLRDEQAATVKQTMDGDDRLWACLGYGHDDTIYRDDYYKKVIAFGRYFRIFGPFGVCHTEYEPVLCYGVFDDGKIEAVLHAWIEFRYNRAIWVIYENRDRQLEVARFAAFLASHPNMVYRGAVEFVYHSLDAKLSRKAPLSV